MEPIWTYVFKSGRSVSIWRPGRFFGLGLANDDGCWHAAFGPLKISSYR